MVAFLVIPFYRTLKRDLCVGKPKGVRFFQVRIHLFELRHFRKGYGRDLGTAVIIHGFQPPVKKVYIQVVHFPGTAKVFHEKPTVVIRQTSHVNGKLFSFVHGNGYEHG